MKNYINKIIQGDCLEVMKTFDDNSINMIFADLPYGTTACEWDIIIPFKTMWKEFNRILINKGYIILTGSQPFTTKLINSNIDNFSHQWIWQKEQGSNPLLANKQPMKNFEDILVFNNSQYDEFYNDKRRKYFKKIVNFIGKEKSIIIKETNQGLDHCFRFKSLQFGIPTEKNYNLLIKKYGIDKMEKFKKYEYINEKRTYNPQKIKGKKYKSGGGCVEHLGVELKGGAISEERYPTSIIKFNTDKTKSLHPTQKPVALLEYLIKTYTNKGDIILDPVIGSGTTCVAAKNLNRNYIGIEISEEYCEIARQRLRQNTLL